MRKENNVIRKVIYSFIVFVGIFSFFLVGSLRSGVEGLYSLSDETALPGIIDEENTVFHHYPVAISINGTVVALEDGTQWIINKDDNAFETVSSWNPSDIVIITLDDTSPYYNLKNITNDTSVPATFFPVVSMHNISTRVITEISDMDSDTRIVLNDGLVWVVEEELSETWSVGDVVTIARAEESIWHSITGTYFEMINIDRNDHFSCEQEN
ncbi:MAG: hypothetical protein HN411_03500 [Waddliaceae bacterium]|jgi:hypothetical protein|nr:hypothetical protein [Waddliaceae bacterium]MBT3579571.1 hypothetical protein [Waddliaceae bacterium]MBT4444433.1 hypothetical protein [Waddliaceae bacterium]MBT6928178.1 hypothetical protein [Waddliaceae bacterium]MBT7264323.1 hypothetical protein [Waddliaceae bacterium]